MNSFANNFTQRVIDAEGYVNPKAVAKEFHTTVKVIASITGLAITVLSKKARARSTAAQQRLQEMVQIINRATPWCGHPAIAYAWYCSEPLPSFGDRTAQFLVKEGKASDVMQCLDRLSEGGFA